MEFDEALRRFAKHLDLAPKQVVEHVTLELWNKITANTPVDTGRARAGWMISTGHPATGVPAEKGKPTGKNKNSASPPPEPRVSYPEPKITGEEVVYITNNLPYIGVLEEGSSKQAPAGMVRTSIAEVKAGIKFTVELLDQG